MEFRITAVDWLSLSITCGRAPLMLRPYGTVEIFLLWLLWSQWLKYIADIAEQGGGGDREGSESHLTVGRGYW